jgi:hypothetical protein
MDDADFKKMLGSLNQNPALLQMYMQDKRMQLVGGGWGWGVGF